MQRFGTDEDGFAVTIDKTAGTVLVEMWGFWSARTAGALESAVGGACRVVRGARLDLDATKLRPQSTDGVEAFRALLISLPKLRVAGTKVTTSSPLTRLQLFRIAKEHSETGAVEFVSLAATQ